MNESYPVGTKVYLWYCPKKFIVKDFPTETNDKIEGEIVYYGKNVYNGYFYLIKLDDNKEVRAVYHIEDFEKDLQPYLEKNCKYWSTYHKYIAGAVIKSPVSEGMFCCDCLDFYPMAESNLNNGKLLCYSCRDTKSWKYEEELKVKV
jgi:hypothetical protein